MELTPDFLTLCIADDTMYAHMEDVRQMRVLPAREPGRKKLRTRPRAVRNARKESNKRVFGS